MKFRGKKILMNQTLKSSIHMFLKFIKTTISFAFICLYDVLYHFFFFLQSWSTKLSTSELVE